MNQNDNMSYITQDIVELCGVTRTTLYGWLRRYTVDGKPIGNKVGGRWRVNLQRLRRFLRNDGVSTVEIDALTK